MARHGTLLIIGWSLVYLSGMVCAQDVSPKTSPSLESTPISDQRPQSPTDRARPRFHDGKDRDWKDRDSKELRDPRLREIRELFNQLPEDMRQQLIDKTRRWQQMPADEQAHFRFMRGEREKRVQQAVDDTIQAGGLQLNEAQKQKFAEIYKRERRKLEESLRAEMDQRRQERLPDLQKSVVEAYRKDLEDEPAVAAPSPSPSPASTP